ncbi:MAG: hypothetical protein ACE14L_12715 [Terriglobales bacterium]
MAEGLVDGQLAFKQLALAGVFQLRQLVAAAGGVGRDEVSVFIGKLLADDLADVNPDLLGSTEEFARIT